MKPLRILFVHPAIEISIWDVARGYRSALERAGHEVRDYFMGKHIDYHLKALPEGLREDQYVVSRQATENVLVEAIYHQADLVVFISGLGVHPIALWLLTQVQIPSAVVFTESPYDDESQRTWQDLSQTGTAANITVFTNDRFSAGRFGWNYLPPAFDPAVHFPAEPKGEEKCDVLMIGTGWGDRQSFLEAVNWTGIDFRIYGVWPKLTADSPIHRFYRPMVVDNAHIAPFYRSAKICLNFNRRHAEAMTPGPRIYELAGCNTFILSDERPDMWEMFGESIPTFYSPESLENIIRHYLKPEHEAERLAKAAAAHEAVKGETFDSRAARLISVVTANQPQPQGV